MSKIINFFRLEKIIIKIVSMISLFRLSQMSRKKENNFSIVVLTSHKDILKLIICMYSLLRFLDSNPLITVCDDGSITEKDKKMLKKIPRCRIMSFSSLKTKIENKFPENFVRNRWNSNAFDRKLFNLFVTGNSEKKQLLVDCDVVFYKKPIELINFLTKKTTEPFMYISDFQNAYIWSLKKIKSMLNIIVHQRVNTGCFAFESSKLSKKFIINFYKLLELDSSKDSVEQRWTEQTALACLSSSYESRRLPKTYYVGLGAKPKDIICRHYTVMAEDEYAGDLLGLINERSYE